MRTAFLSSLVTVIGLGAFFSCSTGSQSTLGGFGSGGSGPVFNAGGNGSIINQTPNGWVDLSGEPSTPGCGDGVLTQDEACDDGNKESGDGCLWNCRQVEIGFSCVPAGQLCHPIARCGDTVKVFPELCDDGNTVAGDGCSPTCKYETGYKCEGTPSVCTKTVCGDGKIEGAESCEDGNAVPFDGCSADCQNEPKCETGSCTSSCGDGIMLGEEKCDDGNNIDGDGCNKDCVPEDGFTCRQPDLGESMTVPMIVRDFNAGGDFEKGSSFSMGLNYANQGLLKASLEGAKRKPVLASSTGTYDGAPGKDSGIGSPSSFAMWYDDSAPAAGNTRNGSPLITKLNLYLKADKSAYVNRYGNLGDGSTGAQYQRTKTQTCGNVNQSNKDEAGNPIPCTACYYDPNPATPQCDQNDKTPCQTDPTYTGECKQDGNNWLGTFLEAAFDGNPLFFPADKITPFSPNTTAQISGNYHPSWPEMPGMHNFSFTTEVRYWFQYDEKKNYTLRFIGDDDVWVFINSKLAVDLGGIHTAVQGELTFGASGAPSVVVTPTNVQGGNVHTSKPDLGLANGKVYEIVVLHAERQTKASSYQLTLSGFSAAPSDCSPICGDGIVGIGEECDDGVNDGGYGECGPGCRLGEFCGDGVVQTGEDCDDGINVGNPCPSGCRRLIIL